MAYSEDTTEESATPRGEVMIANAEQNNVEHRTAIDIFNDIEKQKSEVAGEYNQGTGASVNGNRDGVATKPKPKSKAERRNECSSLTAYSLNGGIEKLKRELKNAVYLIDGLAVMGELTIFGAPPNGGKTLLSIAGIIESVKAGRVQGSKVFYINCDDNQRGAISKTEILEPLGVQMVVPVLADRDKTGGLRFDLGKILQSKIDDEKVDGEVIVLDTYKKFMSVMNKDDQREFNIILRDFVTVGGTALVLAHTNKNKNTEGNYVLGGTSDLKDDADCCWIIDPVDTEGGRLYTFQFQKGRGVPGNDKCFFVPQIEEDDYTKRYHMMLSSVEERDAGDRKDDYKRELLRAYHPAVTLIKEELATGSMSRQELTAAYNDSDIKFEVPRRKFQDVLMAFAGDMWDVQKVGRSKMFSLINTA